MKQITRQTTLLLWVFMSTILSVTGQAIPAKSILAIHYGTIEVNPGHTLDEYLEYWYEKMLPAYKSILPEIEIQNIAGVRGECKNSVGFFMLIPDENIMQKYWQKEGTWSEYGLKQMSKIASEIEQLNKIGTSKDNYTDWVVDPAPDEMMKYVTNQVPPNPFKGTWELIEGEYFGNKRDDGPFQYKIFDDHHFNLIMKNKEGEWNMSGVGTYTFTDREYSETFMHTSRKDQDEGTTMTWDYTVKGDTLFMSGPTSVVKKDGGKNSEQFQKLINSMKETRVKAK